MQLRSFLENEIVNFHHLVRMGNLFRITLIKLFLFSLILLMAFFLVSSMHNLLRSMCNLFSIMFLDVLILVYTPRIYLIAVKVKLTFTCFFSMSQVLLKI